MDSVKKKTLSRIRFTNCNFYIYLCRICLNPLYKANSNKAILFIKSCRTIYIYLCSIRLNPLYKANSNNAILFYKKLQNDTSMVYTVQGRTSFVANDDWTDGHHHTMVPPVVFFQTEWSQHTMHTEDVPMVWAFGHVGSSHLFNSEVKIFTHFSLFGVC